MLIKTNQQLYHLQRPNIIYSTPGSNWPRTFQSGKIMPNVINSGRLQLIWFTVLFRTEFDMSSCFKCFGLKAGVADGIAISSSGCLAYKSTPHPVLSLWVAVVNRAQLMSMLGRPSHTIIADVIQPAMAMTFFNLIFYLQECLSSCRWHPTLPR